jgi:hypothetical protein
MFGGNGGLHGFIIGNPKYIEGPKGLGGLGGLCGFEPLLLGSNAYLTKIMSTFLGIFVCTLTSYVPFGVWGLNLIPTTIWVGAVTNGVLVIVIIDRGIAT